MTQEEKNLLITDLCARLPFKVKVEVKGLHKVIEDDYNNRNIINAHVLLGLNLRDSFKTCSIDYTDKLPLFNRKGECNIKPYLFPQSNMTQEQMVEYYNTFFLDDDCNKFLTDKSLEWLYKNHIDIYGLIPMGLAIDATGLGIYE